MQDVHTDYPACAVCKPAPSVEFKSSPPSSPNRLMRQQHPLVNVRFQVALRRSRPGRQVDSGEGKTSLHKAAIQSTPFGRRFSHRLVEKECLMLLLL